MRGLARDRRGATTILVAGGLTALFGIGAFAVDMGSVYLDSRRLQGMADAAALSAAGDLTHATAAATAAVTANGMPTAVATSVQTGRYLRDAAVPVASRFTPGATANAARVTLTTQVPLWFAGVLTGRRTATVVRRATAMRSPLAAFSLGTRVAGLNGGIENALISALLGGTVSLGVIDYRRLIDTDLDMMVLLDALRTAQGLGGASYAAVLATSTTVPVYLRAAATALDSAGRPDAANAMRALAAASPARTLLPSTLIDPGALAGRTSAGGTRILVSAWDVAQAAVTLGGGARTVAVDMGAALPGLVGSKLWLAIGQRAVASPWLAVTATGTPVLRTAQTRLYIETNAGITGLTGIASLSIPLYVEVGAATAALSAIDCTATPATATLAVAPALGHASITKIAAAALGDLSVAPAEPGVTLASATLLSIFAKGRVDFSATAAQAVTFTTADVTAGTVKSVSSGGISTGIVGSLLANTTITPSILGFGLGLGASGVTALVRPVLVAATAPLDAAVGEVLGLLGLHVGQADVRMNGLRCGQPILVA